MTNYNKEEQEFIDGKLIGSIPVSRDGFNENPEKPINLLDYMHLTPPNLHGGTFIGYKWLNVRSLGNHLKANGGQSQSLLRDGGTTAARSAEFSTVFSNKGWDTSYFPPIFAEESTATKIGVGKQYTGHARTAGAIDRNEKYMPVAIYRFEESDSPTIDYIIAAQADNGDHAPATRTKMADFRTSLVGILTSGELEIPKEREKLEEVVRKILEKETYAGGLGVKRVFSDPGTITKIINQACTEYLKGSSPVIIRNNKEWQEWANDNISGQKFVCNVTNTSYFWGLWIDKILKKANGTNPVKVIFYTTKNNPSTALAEMRKFEGYLKKAWADSYRLVKNYVYNSPNFTLLSPDQIASLSPIEVLGAVPQFEKHHDITSNSVVPLDEYLNLKSS